MLPRAIILQDAPLFSHPRDDLDRGSIARGKSNLSAMDPI